MKLLRINEAARELGVSEAWLRRTEGRVEVPRAKRDLNGWRVYSLEDFAALCAVLLPNAPDKERHDRGSRRGEGGTRS